MATTNTTKFRKGDRVRFRLVTRWVYGSVTEDRGAIGVGGRRLYSVEFRSDNTSGASHVELPAEDLRPRAGRVGIR